MSFSGDLYPTAGADVVMTTTGDLVRYNAGARQRLGIGSTNQALSVVGGLPAWKTLELAESTLTTEGDILFENSTPALDRLPAGTSGYFLKTQGASNPPVWSAVSAGASTALDNLSSVAVNDTIDMNVNNLINVKMLNVDFPFETAIASGAVAFAYSNNTIDTEADAATDNLDYFDSLTDGDIIICRSAVDSRDPTLRSAITGGTKMSGNGSYTLELDSYRWYGIAQTGNPDANFSIME